MKRLKVKLFASSLLISLSGCVTPAEPQKPEAAPSEEVSKPVEQKTSRKRPTEDELEAEIVRNRTINTIAKSDSISERMGKLKGSKSKPVTVEMNGIKFTFEDRNGIALIDDIVLGETQEIIALAAQRSVIAGNPWRTRLVPYEYDSTYPEARKAEFERAVTTWNTNSTIRFYPRRKAPAGGVSPDRDWVRVQNRLNKDGNESGCWARLGRRGGVQEINLGAGCVYRQMIHEIGHTVGLVHEQNRMDRDDFVKFYPENVKVDPADPDKDYKLQFDVEPSANLPLEFDFASRMLYQVDAFAKPGKNTLTRLDGTTWRTAQELSPGDWETVGEVYGYRVAPREKRYLVKNGQNCITPSSVNPVTGEAHDPASPFNDTVLLASSCSALARPVTVEKWRFRADGSIRGYAGKCFDTQKGLSADDTVVTMRVCPAKGPTASQKWVKKDDKSIRGIAGKCLTAKGSGDSLELKITACAEPLAESQKWEVTEVAPWMPPQPAAP